MTEKKVTNKIINKNIKKYLKKCLVIFIKSAFHTQKVATHCKEPNKKRIMIIG